MKTYLLDFDGTMVDSMPEFVWLMKKILDDNNVSYGDNLMKIITPLGYEGTAEYFSKIGVKGTKEEILNTINEYAFYVYKEKIPAKKNVISVLKELKARGVSLNILSASPKNLILICLERLGISGVFDNIWSSDDFNIPKNNPEIYLETSKKLEVEVRDVFFFDDNVNAAKAAKKAGMKVCGVYDDSSSEFTDELKQISDFFVYDFKEILEIKE